MAGKNELKSSSALGMQTFCDFKEIAIKACMTDMRYTSRFEVCSRVYNTHSKINILKIP